MEFERMGRVTVVFDNYKSDDRMQTGWGFAAYVEANGRRVLFDTGPGMDPLRKNMAALGLEADDIDSVVISHRHADHAGGLGALPRRLQVIVPGKGGIGGGQRVVENRGVQDLGGGMRAVLVGGVLPEQFLLAPGDARTLILCGCAHPGVGKMVEAAAERAPGKKYLLMGGLHLSGAPQDALAALCHRLRDLGVEAVAPCHCSGQEARDAFSRFFGEGFITAAAGSVVEF